MGYAIKPQGELYMAIVLKKSILSWRKILLGLYGEPVEYDPKDIPVNYNSHNGMFRWCNANDRVGDWFCCRNFMIGLDHITSPVSLTILFKLEGRVYYQQIFSVDSTGKLGTLVNYRELKFFLGALKNPNELPMCINYEWAKELLRGAFNYNDSTDNW